MSVKSIGASIGPWCCFQTVPWYYLKAKVHASHRVQCIIDEFTRESLAIHFKKQLEKECGLSLIDPYKRLTHARAIFANPVVMDKTGRTFETGIYRRNDGRCANGATNRPAIEGSVG